MTVHEVVIVGGDGRHSTVVKEDSSSIFFEGLDASHIHSILVVAVV